eukprot:7173723-Ditylum_brightwellii.AAC.1
MMTYLCNKKIFIKLDRFETKETASPGFFTQLHPQLTWKQDMKDTLLGELKSIELNKEEVQQKWMADNEPDWTDDKNPVLDFVLEMTQRKFGNSVGRVETT